MNGGTIFGSAASGVPEHLANVIYSSYGYPSAALHHDEEAESIRSSYSDGSDILPHTDGFVNWTDYTIIGK